MRRPVTSAELLAIDSYRFDGTQNYLPGLKETSLKLSQLTENAKYRQALNLPDQHLDIINYYRRLRNQIHLPNEPVPVPNVQIPGTVVDFLTTFINAEVIRLSNELIARHSMGFALHKPLS